MSERIQITVIVPIYQQWPLAQTLFDCLAAQTLPQAHWEVLAVDNGSDVVPLPQQLPGFVRLLHCERPGSYAARNAAIDRARGELLVFTDADCLPHVDWLQAHWEAYCQHGNRQINAGAITVKKLTDDAPNQYEQYDILLGIPQKRYAQKRGFGVTANLAVPRDVFDRSGRFNADRFSGGDAEFCRRARRDGVGLAYVDAAGVVHPARSSWTALATKARRIKAAQMRHGPLRWRVINLLRTLLPPQLALRTITAAKIGWRQKPSLVGIAIRLRLLEIVEIIRLLRGATPERM